MSSSENIISYTEMFKDLINKIKSKNNGKIYNTCTQPDILYTYTEEKKKKTANKETVGGISAAMQL